MFSSLLSRLERLGAGLQLDADAQSRLTSLLRQAFIEGARASWSGERRERPNSLSSMEPEAGSETMWPEDEVEAVEIDADVFSEDRGHLGRYLDIGALGQGAVGDVRRVLDLPLNRRMALKVLREEALGRETLARFIEEAQITAQLDHPGIVPVHELGRLEDGRVYFTMREVRGRTLTHVIRELHRAAVGTRWPTGSQGWTLRRVLDAFHRAVEAVAYAHSRGVVHRDLKPANILVGSFGEVQVVDWGLAKVLRSGQPGPAGEQVVTTRIVRGGHATHVGRVAGTPSYMAPEQARGENDRVGPPADVHALGATLFRILVGRPPYAGPTSLEIVARVAVGDRAPLEGPLPIPDGLAEICERCLSFRAEDRYPDAGALAAALGDWLEGTRNRAAALETLDELAGQLQRAQELRDAARRTQERAATLLIGVQAHDPPERKLEGWALEDSSAQLEHDANALEGEVVSAMRALSTQVPDLPEAHTLLADYFRRRHQAAQEARDPLEARRAERLLRAHDHGRYEAYLEGLGRLSLQTEPPGALVELHEYVHQGRRLVLEPRAPMGRAPIQEALLPAGSYRLTLRAPGHAPLHVPLCVERERRWTTRGPEDAPPTPLVLPELGALSEGEVLMPRGWFIAGGDPLAYCSMPRTKVWVDDLVVMRDPVTNAEYLAFLNDLVEQGEGDLAQLFAPREFTGVLFDAGGAVSWPAEPDGRLRLPARHHPDWPVSMVDWHAARAYASWLAARTGQPWRLPRELEWEKATRGVDGRFFSFGDHLDPSFCAQPGSLPGPASPSTAEAFPLDVSPFGVRSATGNVRTWCLDAWSPTGPRVEAGRPTPLKRDEDALVRVVRGGSWLNSRGGSRLAGRYPCRATERIPYVGIRLVRAAPPSSAP